MIGEMIGGSNLDGVVRRRERASQGSGRTLNSARTRPGTASTAWPAIGVARVSVGRHVPVPARAAVCSSAARRGNRRSCAALLHRGSIPRDSAREGFHSWCGAGRHRCPRRSRRFSGRYHLASRKFLPGENCGYTSRPKDARRRLPRRLHGDAHRPRPGAGSPP